MLRWLGQLLPLGLVADVLVKEMLLVSIVPVGLAVRFPCLSCGLVGAALPGAKGHMSAGHCTAAALVGAAAAEDGAFRHAPAAANGAGAKWSWWTRSCAIMEYQMKNPTSHSYSCFAAATRVIDRDVK